jgi:3-hydroxyacyl-[acyl-carrier-protein] dehydratase
MLFKDNFYTLKSSVKEDESHTYSIQLNPDHSIFEGHFPDNPVTPGVVQMEIVKELMNESTGTKLNLKKMGNCKFLAILNPKTDANVDVILKISKGEDEEIKVSAVIKNAETFFLKMNASYFPA